MTDQDQKDIFEKLKSQLLKFDPVVFCETYLKLEGKPFTLHGNGYKPLIEIYRYLGIKALEPTAKPVIMVKGRQVGATIMATALEMYFMCSGLFGVGDKPPIRVIHAFPQLELAEDHSKTKLNQMILTSIDPNAPEVKPGTKAKSYLQSLMDPSTAESNKFKQFLGGNHLWVESIGVDGNRVMGKQLCLETELPTPQGFVKLKNLQEGDELFDEQYQVCRITKLHPIDLKSISYRMFFSDGATVDACEDHLWLTYTTDERYYNFTPSVQSTKQILQTLKFNNEPNHSIKKPIIKNNKLEGYQDIIITNIEPIDPKPMRCLTVDSPSHLFLITRQYIPTHNTADVMLIDEIQRTNSLAIGNAQKVLTASKYGPKSKGVVFYFGTPLKKGSDYYKMWQTSSQQYYYLGCEKCKEHFPLYTPGSNDWEKIWIYGYIVKCPLCGHEQNKLEAAERGKWVAIRDPNDPDTQMIGFHLNQLYMPMFSREDIDAQKPGIHPINTERVFMNEVLGEFFQGDSSPITAEEISEVCGDPGRKMVARIVPGENSIHEMTVLGIDYGAKSDVEQLANIDKITTRGQSYSTAVVLQSKGPGLLSIEYATKFKRNDPEAKKGIINQLLRQYNIQLAVGDIGYSHDFSYMMHKDHGDRYIVSRAHPTVNNRVKFRSDAFPKEIVFERDFYIGELFEQMKKGMIRFPFGDYEKIAWLVEHCASMDIKPSISRTGGDPTIHYVKGGTPNDGFMALLNAYLAYKFIITRQFTNNGNPLKEDYQNFNKPLVVGGYIRRRL